jgi:hypothetical protein
LARRGGISGLNPKDEVECDMIAEACKDLISVVANSPFRLQHFIRQLLQTFNFINKSYYAVISS